MSKDHRRSVMRGLAKSAILSASLLAGAICPDVGFSQEAPGSEYPPFDKVTEGYTKVESKSPLDT
jgi:hypothetical protein